LDLIGEPAPLDWVRRLHLPLFPINAALTNLVHGHQNQSRKGDDDQSNSSKAVQLLNLAVQILSHILIEKREATKTKKRWAQKTRSDALPSVRKGSIEISRTSTGRIQ